jgi:hypothetical protein
MADVVTETVVLEGKRVVVSLDASGLLQWRGDREGQLLVRSDLIGFRSEGSSVHLFTFKMSETTKICGKGLPGRKRRDIVMEFDNEAAIKLFCDSIQKKLDESGSSMLANHFFEPWV